MLNIYGNGKTAEELTSDDIFALMQAIEASTMAGDSVDDEGNRLWGSALMQAAADCSALWYKDLRTREGDIAADQKIKDDIQSGQFQEILEKSGVDPMQYLVDTGFDMKLKTDPSTHSRVENIMKMTNKNDQADEFVKMLVKLDGNGKPIVKNNKYILDDEKHKNLLQSMVKIGNESGIPADEMDALSVALRVAGVGPETYYEYGPIMEHVNNGGITVTDVNGDGKIDYHDTPNILGDNIFEIDTRYADLTNTGSDGRAYTGILIKQEGVTDEGDYFILGDFPTHAPGSEKHTIVIKNSLSDVREQEVNAHEETHIKQFEYIYTLLNYGRDQEGNLVADDCLDKATCRGTLWQYVNKKMKKELGYVRERVKSTMPSGNQISHDPYWYSPFEGTAHIVGGWGYKKDLKKYIIPWNVK